MDILMAISGMGDGGFFFFFWGGEKGFGTFDGLETTSFVRCLLSTN